MDSNRSKESVNVAVGLSLTPDLAGIGVNLVDLVARTCLNAKRIHTFPGCELRSITVAASSDS